MLWNILILGEFEISDSHQDLTGFCCRLTPEEIRSNGSIVFLGNCEFSVLARCYDGSILGYAPIIYKSSTPGAQSQPVHTLGMPTAQYSCCHISLNMHQTEALYTDIESS